MTRSDSAPDEAKGPSAPGSDTAFEGDDVVLQLLDACVAVAGVPLLQGSTRVRRGQRVAWVGDWTGVFSLALGRAELLRGSAIALGRPLSEALAAGVVSVAPRQLDVVSGWTVREYVEAACRLWRLPTQRVGRVFEELGATGMAARKVASLAVAEMRALSLLLAALSQSAVALVDAPFAGLDDVGQRVVARFLSRLAERSTVVVTFADADAPPSAAPPSAAADFFESCDAVCHAHGGHILELDPRAADLSQPSRFRVTVVGGSERFGVGLALGASQVERAQLSGILADRQDASTWIVSLEPGTGSAAVLDAAAAAGATVVELLPLAPELAASNP